MLEKRDGDPQGDTAPEPNVAFPREVPNSFNAKIFSPKSDNDYWLDNAVVKATTKTLLTPQDS